VFLFDVNAPRTSALSTVSALIVLLISGVCGFWVGAIGFPTWAIPVESAQVVAGIVRYPADNPFYIYHTRIWTIVIQLCAVLLRSGVSEMTLSRAISGILGMVSFQALALGAYAVGADVLMAVGSAFVIFFSRITDTGVVYPVMLLDTHHNYGALGLSMLVLVAALLGARCFRLGGFLLGLAPAVHPSLAVWVGLAMLMAFLWDFRGLVSEFRPGLKYFLIGGAISAISLAAQVLFISRSLPVDLHMSAAYFRAFVNVWDEHRRSVQMSQAGVIVNWACLGIALVWLKLFKSDLSAARQFFLRTVAAAAALGLAASAFTWIPADHQPVLLSMLMPARLLNFNVMVICPLVVGLLSRQRDDVLGEALLALFLAALLVNTRSMLDWHLLNPMPVLVFGALAAVVPRKSGLEKGAGVLFSANGLQKRSPGPFLRSLFRYAAAGVCAVAAVLTLRIHRPASSVYRDRTNDPFFAAVASEQQGLVLTGGSYQLVQLYTRRPVLIDGGGLDSMTYAPDTGPATAAILRDVYDIDFFNPPPWAKGSSLLPHDYVKAVWARFSSAKWQEIGRAYHVTQVLTRSDYNLQLPVAAEEGSFRLYRIPQ